jgi:hypothetical protein
MDWTCPIFLHVEHAGAPFGKARYSRDGDWLGGNTATPCTILKSESSSLAQKDAFPHGSGLARAPSAVFAHMQERPSQWLVAGGAFCQIRFFGFLLRNSFDIALTTMAVVGSQKFRERRTFFDRFRRKEKGRHHCRPFRGL